MNRSTRFAVSAALSFAATSVPGSLHAQGIGSYLNFETPVHDPMKVASVDGTDYLLVCNAPDNCVEVYTATTDPTFVLRVPTGQEPTAIVVRPTPTAEGGIRAYTANWLGDSITSFELAPNAAPGPALEARIVRTTFVGDEPIGIAILPEIAGLSYSQPGGLGHESLFVTFAAQAGWGWFHPETLAPIVAGWNTLELVVEEDDPGTEGVEHLGIKEPRTIAFSPATAAAPNVPNLLCVLNYAGGNDPATYDMDLWVTDDPVQSAFDLNNPAGQSQGPFHALPYVLGTGSANFAMAFAPNGDLWVASQHARNREMGMDEFVEGVGEPEALRLVVEETGFVRSQLVRVRAAGTSTNAVEVHDLNLENGGQAAVPVTQPTHVLVYGSGDEGETRVFVTGFGSDSIGMVEPTDAGDPQAWDVTRIDVEYAAMPFDHDSLDGRMRGPRAFALKASGTPNDPGDVLYCYNRIEHSVTVLDPNFSKAAPQSAILRTFRLQHDPTPRHVKSGRKFLYSSRLSASGTVSCSSCHLDGKTDWLAWNLSDDVPVLPEGDPNALPDALGPNAAIKGPMQTQFLLGLTTFEVADDVTQDELFSARPYHWRGDRGFFEHFNGAFISLMGIPNPHSATEGIPPEKMRDYRDHVFSMHYAPNPDQPFDRRYGGSFFDEAEPPTDEMETLAQLNDPSVGSGARKGLKLFHQVPSDATVGALTSCVNCHSLPEGSNNRLTDLELNFVGFEGSQPQDIETAQMRGLHLKHKRILRRNFAGDFKYFPNAPGLVPARTAEFGMTHTGLNSIDADPFDPSDTLLDFNLSVFLGVGIFNVVDLSHYSLEFDTGVAPSVGFTGTVDTATYGANPQGFLDALLEQELQVTDVNAGLAVHARVDGVMHGFHYDATDAGTPYHEVPHAGVTPIGSLATADLLDLLDTGGGADPDNLLVFHFTALGSARRVAYLDGGTPPSAGLLAPPTNLQLLGCRPMSANREIPLMTTFWEDSIDNILANPSGPNDPFNVGDTNLTIFWYQQSLLSWAGAATPPGFGLPQLRHEPPRRFRVQGDGIQHGAVLRLYAPTAADIATATTTTPPTTTPVAAQTTVVQVPLYAGRDESGVFWETAVELEAMRLYGFLNGGPNNPWVVTALEDPRDPALADIDTNDLMEPLLWNWWYVEVQNAPNQPASTGSGGWQRLTLD